MDSFGGDYEEKRLANIALNRLALKQIEAGEEPTPNKRRKLNSKEKKSRHSVKHKKQQTQRPIEVSQVTRFDHIVLLT